MKIREPCRRHRLASRSVVEETPNSQASGRSMATEASDSIEEVAARAFVAIEGAMVATSAAAFKVVAAEASAISEEDPFDSVDGK